MRRISIPNFKSDLTNFSKVSKLRVGALLILQIEKLCLKVLHVDFNSNRNFAMIEFY